MNIIGSRFLACNLQPIADVHPEVTVLAAGVSRTTKVDASEYRRERELVEETVRHCRARGHTLIFFSTASAGIYGHTSRPGREDDAVVPASPYGQHKFELECLIRMSAARHLILRLAHVVGPHQADHQLLPSLVRQVESGRVIVHHGAHRDIIDVADMVQITDALVRTGTKEGVINVASGVPYPVELIVARIEDRIGRAAKRNYVHRGDEAPVSIEKLRRLVPAISNIGFGPEYSAGLIDRYMDEYLMNSAEVTT